MNLNGINKLFEFSVGFSFLRSVPPKRKAGQDSKKTKKTKTENRNAQVVLTVRNPEGKEEVRELPSRAG